MLSLDSVDPRSSEIGKINSPRSLEAIRKQGFDLSELVYRPKREFRRGGVMREVAEMRYRHYEEERGKRLRIVTEERRNMIMAGGGSRSRSEVNKPDVEAAVRKMKDRERLLLHRLELKKQKEWRLKEEAEKHFLAHHQPQVEPPHQPHPRPHPSITPSRPALDPKPSHSLLSSSPSKSTPEPTPSTLSMDLSGSEAALLAKIRRQIEAKEKEQVSKQCQLPPTRPILQESPPQLASSVSLDQSRTSALSLSCELEEKDRRHREAMRSLDLTKAKIRLNRQTKANKRIELVKLREALNLQRCEEQRQRLDSEQQRALERFQQSWREKEHQISTIAHEDESKRQLSRLRRDQITEIDAETAQKTYSHVVESLRKSEANRLSRLRAMRRQFDAKNEQFEAKRMRVERIRRINEYQRAKTLDRIVEESEFAERLKGARREELMLKQKLRKELLAEKQSMTERIEKLMSGRGRSSVSPTYQLSSKNMSSGSQSPVLVEPTRWSFVEQSQSAMRQNVSLETGKNALT